MFEHSTNCSIVLWKVSNMFLKYQMYFFIAFKWVLRNIWKNSSVGINLGSKESEVLGILEWTSILEIKYT